MITGQMEFAKINLAQFMWYNLIFNDLLCCNGVLVFQDQHIDTIRP